MHCSAKRLRYSSFNSEDSSDVQSSGDWSSDSCDSHDTFDWNNEYDDDEIGMREKLLQTIENIHKRASLEFASGGVALIPLPGINIDGFGTVSLPVTESNVRDLKKHLQQSLYTNNVWELNPEKFEITNPQFNSGVDKVIQNVKNDLGCPELNVTSHLQNLLLYQPGYHYKPCHNIKEHPGMFATLIIQVPSVFTGGDLVVKHYSQEKTVVFSVDEAAFQCVYAAHYADCQHKRTEITSGYSMALVYSLCVDDNGITSIPHYVSANTLADLLKKIDLVMPYPGLLAWKLDHNYSENSLLGAKGLKGSDKLVFSSLHEANELLDEDKKLEFFLVEAREINIFGGNPNLYQCELDYCKTDHVYNLIGIDGRDWSNMVNFNMHVCKDVLNFTKMEEEFWSEEECSNNSMNKKVSNSYLCYNLLVMLPKANAVKVVYNSSVESTIAFLQQEVNMKGVLPVQRLACHTVEYCIANKNGFCKRVQNVTNLLKILMKMKELELTKKVLMMLSQPCPLKYPFRAEKMSVHELQYPWNIKSSSEIGYGFRSKTMVTVVVDLITTFEWKALSEAVTMLVKSSPPSYNKYTFAFIAQCPDAAPWNTLLDHIVTKSNRMLDAEKDRFTKI